MSRSLCNTGGNKKTAHAKSLWRRGCTDRIVPTKEPQSVYKINRPAKLYEKQLPSQSHGRCISDLCLRSRPSRLPERCPLTLRLKKCAGAPSGTEPCWELADPTMTDIPRNFLTGNQRKGLTGTLKLGAAVKTIEGYAFRKSKLTGLDLSDAASLVSIGDKAFRNTRIAGNIETPFSVPTIGSKVFPVGVSIVKVNSIPGLKECAVAPSGAEPCWELADPAMTDIPTDFLNSNPDLKGTLKLGAAVKTIGNYAFASTKLTSLDLSQAASLEFIGNYAFSRADITGTLMIPAKVRLIGVAAFQDTKLTGLDLSDAASLVAIDNAAFRESDITGTLKLSAAVANIRTYAFYKTKLTGLDLSQAASLRLIVDGAFLDTDIRGTIETPFNVPAYNPLKAFPPGVTIVKG